MAKNRRRNRNRQLVTLVPKPVGVAFVVVVSLALVYLWMGFKCSKYSETINSLQAQCVELDNERNREETKWNGMKTADQLDSLLVRNGLLMVYPNATQIVRVSGASRSSVGATAVATAEAPAPRTGATGATRVAGGRLGR